MNSVGLFKLNKAIEKYFTLVLLILLSDKVIFYV